MARLGVGRPASADPARTSKKAGVLLVDWLESEFSRTWSKSPVGREDPHLEPGAIVERRPGPHSAGNVVPVPLPDRSTDVQPPACCRGGDPGRAWRAARRARTPA